jgi:ABC-type transporter MlaC component
LISIPYKQNRKSINKVNPSPKITLPQSTIHQHIKFEQQAKTTNKKILITNSMNNFSKITNNQPKINPNPKPQITISEQKANPNKCPKS